jgi:large subunit ribosomal protein L24
MSRGRPMRIREGDQVMITAGRDKGKTGRVQRTEPERQVVYIEGLNMVKRHSRPRSVKDTQRGGQVGGIIDKEAPVHVSNVMIIDPGDNKPTRVGISREGGRRVRISKRTGTRID